MLEEVVDSNINDDMISPQQSCRRWRRYWGCFFTSSIGDFRKRKEREIITTRFENLTTALQDAYMVSCTTLTKFLNSFYLVWY
jgi:hypothetical protein